MTHILTAILSALLAAGFAWQWQGDRIKQLELDHAEQRINQQRAARASVERALAQTEKANAAATARAATIRVAATGARNAGNGLRLTTAAAVRSAASDPDASAHAATAIAAVFDQCVGELQALAEVADRHISDIKTLSDSWPKE